MSTKVFCDRCDVELIDGKNRFQVNAHKYLPRDKKDGAEMRIEDFQELDICGACLSRITDKQPTAMPKNKT